MNGWILKKVEKIISEHFETSETRSKSPYFIPIQLKTSSKINRICQFRSEMGRGNRESDRHGQDDRFALQCTSLAGE